MWQYLIGGTPRVNRVAIDNLESRANRINGNLMDQGSSVETLRMEVCRMLLVVEGMRRVMVQKGLMTGEEFTQMLVDMDLEDGVRDGLRTLPKMDTTDCPHCGRKNEKRAYCYFCGQPLHTTEKVSQEKKVCPKCDKANSPRNTKCLYCGASFAQEG